MSELRIGCSGWSYRHWKGGVFYPPKLKAREELAFYASRFDTAEINGSFYRLPGEAMVDGWRERAPDGFLFAWKASRFITHMTRLKEPAEPLALMFSRAERLGPKLGPVLFQLPPQLARDDGRLRAFLEALPSSRRFAFEFRHPSWYAEAVFGLLGEHDAALCISDHQRAPAPWARTAGWVYLRGHGPEGRYFGAYPDQILAEWARRIAGWRQAGADVYGYFDNDPEGAAPRDATRLRALLGVEAEPRQRKA
jgi:uncharacterized protein YecE (DUF72 family)